MEALMTSPNSAPLEGNEQGVLDAGSALKQYIRQQTTLIPNREKQLWLQAAGRTAPEAVILPQKLVILCQRDQILWKLIFYDKYFNIKLDVLQNL